MRIGYLGRQDMRNDSLAAGQSVRTRTEQVRLGVRDRPLECDYQLGRGVEDSDARDTLRSRRRLAFGHWMLNLFPLLVVMT